MSDTISIRKLKRMMYSALRWRLQLPNYFPHNPIPPDEKLTEFSRGVKCAYADLLRSIEEIENSDNQRRRWNSSSEKKSVQYGTYEDDDYDYMQEIRHG